ncbi:MAG TPA: PKD domain-containing protein, partial [Solirubrobacteraceae bacterium]|nr:PKD domain-containing protein [Solirubrobacteraceae bacterium]
MSNIVRWLVVNVAVACAALALPTYAAATSYCVNDPACVSAGGTEEGGNGEALQDALTAAKEHPGPNTVVIGAGEYTREKGFEYKGSEQVTIAGAGQGKTILSSGTEDATAFTLDSAGSTLAELSVAVPAGKDLQGVQLEAGTVEDISIAGGGENFSTGLSISGGKFAHGSIEMVESGPTADEGVDLTGGEVLDSTITGIYGVQGAVGGAIRGCRISAKTTAFDAYYAKTTIEDTLIDLQGGGVDGVSIVGNGNGDAEGVLRNITIVNGGASAVGVYVEGNKAHSSTVAIESSIIADVGHAIVLHTEEAGSTAAVTSDYSSYETAGDESTTADGGTAPSLPTDENPTSTTADFVHPVLGEHGFSEGDWHLAPGSPLIDAGKPGALEAGEYEFDAEGNPRIVHGRRDVGAYEYQWRAPAVSASASATTVKVGEAVTFSGSASDSEPGDSIASYQWTFDDGASVPAGATATHAFATTGVHKATLTVRDAAGVSTTAVVSVTVEPLPVTKGTSIRTGCVCGRGAAQRLSSLELTPKAFRPAPSGPSVTSKRHVGARVSFALSRAGTVVFTVQMLLPGFAHGHECLAVRRGGKAKRCVRRLKVHGSFSRDGNGG